MEIEKVINHQFQNESQKLIAELLYSANWLENLIAKALSPLDISFQQLNVLRIIHGQEANKANVQVIKDRMIDDRSNVSRLLNKLCEKGFTLKDRCTRDQRVVYIALTEKGIEVMKQGKAKMEQIQFSLNNKKLQNLNNLLEELRS
ncbi:MarR family transcriptional regulator [uncultured Marivirga sp.]|uniref:MarR family winged helix-turn-helix transcriptional regulator n=1 Tax=uncultured Marivirga sp. TaxID=1123707 RepID=UPI0030EC420E|tara:strand:+ start:319135 stop:319572 length:438 start_codon:yes stop_codon:yes gene_type:complete